MSLDEKGKEGMNIDLRPLPCRLLRLLVCLRAKQPGRAAGIKTGGSFLKKNFEGGGEGGNLGRGRRFHEISEFKKKISIYPLYMIQAYCLKYLFWICLCSKSAK